MPKYTLTALYIVFYFYGSSEALNSSDDAEDDAESAAQSTLEKLTKENDARYRNHKENLNRVTSAIVAAQEHTNQTVESIIDKYDKKVAALTFAADGVDLSFCIPSSSTLDQDAENIILTTTTCTNYATTMAQTKYDTTIILYERIGEQLSGISKMYNKCIFTYGMNGAFPSPTAFQTCVKRVSKAVYELEENIESQKMFVPNSGFDTFGNEQTILANCDATDDITSLRSKARAFYAEMEACIDQNSTIQKLPVNS